MAEPTLIGVFGANATQSATDLIISKADLATVGLTVSATNTPESLLAAIIALAQAALGEVTYGTNTDQSITITDGSDALTSRGTVRYRQTTKTIDFFKPDTSGAFDPDDY
jgi:hypothetical protein